MSSLPLSVLRAWSLARPPARGNPGAAGDLAHDLTAAGRLAPADAWVPADLEPRLAQLANTSTE